MTQVPYLTSPGNIQKALEAIKSAQTPPKVSQDFVKTKLGITGSSGDQMTTFLKRIGFSNDDGSPTQIYRDWRGQHGGKALAKSIRHGYASLYEHNEYLHECSEKDIRDIVIRVTGQAADARPVSLIVSTLRGLITRADFSDEPEDSRKPQVLPSRVDSEESQSQSLAKEQASSRIGFNIGYTINLNLPETTNVEVFNAIFKSLREHLLRNDDV